MSAEQWQLILDIAKAVVLIYAGLMAVAVVAVVVGAVLMWRDR